MKRILITLLLTTSIFATQAWGIPIIGVNDPANNRAEWTETFNTIFIYNDSEHDARITSFGFEATNDIDGIFSVTGTESDGRWEFVTDQSVGGAGGGDFEFGVTTANSGNLIGGFPNGGIAVGNTGTFVFNTAGGLGTVTNHFIRFQRTGADRMGSDRGNSCTVDCGIAPPPPPPSEVPEPSSLLLLGIGMIGAVAARRRKPR